MPVVAARLGRLRHSPSPSLPLYCSPPAPPSPRPVPALPAPSSTTSGAVIPNAKVTVTDTATSVANRTVSSSAGTYSIKGLPPGKYSVTVEASGFKKAVRRMSPSRSARLPPSTLPSPRVLPMKHPGHRRPDRPEHHSTRTRHHHRAGRGRRAACRSHPAAAARSISSSSSPPAPPAAPFLTASAAAWTSNRRSSTTASPPPSRNRRLHHQLQSPLRPRDRNTTSSAPLSPRNSDSARALLLIPCDRAPTGTTAIYSEINRNSYFDSVGFFNGPAWRNGKVLQADTRTTIYGFTVGGPIRIPHVYNGRNKTSGYTARSGTSRKPRYRPLHRPHRPRKDWRLSDFVDGGTGKFIPIFDPDTGEQFQYNGRLNVIPPGRISKNAAVSSPPSPTPIGREAASAALTATRASLPSSILTFNTCGVSPSIRS